MRQMLDAAVNLTAGVAEATLRMGLNDGTTQMAYSSHSEPPFTHHS